MRRLIIGTLCLTLIYSVFSISAFAQENPTGTLVGTVTDAQGGAVVGAKVTVTDTASGASASTKSGDGGQFTVGNLAPAVYKVTIEMANFKTSVYTDVTIILGKTYTLPAKMEVGEAKFTVQVEGGGEQLMETLRA